MFIYEDILKREIFEMQKGLQHCYMRIKKLNEKIRELEAEEPKSDSRQLEFNF
tara:strand:- start:1336 stop:1494 length:159 start_codon:yes stop_codon:yes gene_type:complete